MSPSSKRGWRNGSAGGASLSAVSPAAQVASRGGHTKNAASMRPKTTILIPRANLKAYLSPPQAYTSAASMRPKMTKLIPRASPKAYLLRKHTASVAIPCARVATIPIPWESFKALHALPKHIDHDV